MRNRPWSAYELTTNRHATTFCSLYLSERQKCIKVRCVAKQEFKLCGVDNAMCRNVSGQQPKLGYKVHISAIHHPLHDTFSSSGPGRQSYHKQGSVFPQGPVLFILALPSPDRTEGQGDYPDAPLARNFQVRGLVVQRLSFIPPLWVYLGFTVLSHSLRVRRHRFELQPAPTDLILLRPIRETYGPRSEPLLLLLSHAVLVEISCGLSHIVCPMARFRRRSVAQRSSPHHCLSHRFDRVSWPMLLRYRASVSGCQQLWPGLTCAELHGLSDAT